MTHSKRFPAFFLLVLAIFAVSSPVGVYQAYASINQLASNSTSSYSWNPKVTCTPLIVRITDITVNQTGTASFNAGPFSPGITTNVTGGDAKRWLTPSSTTPLGWHSPGPACTVTNSRGTKSLFVQINGIERDYLANEDYSSAYNPVNGGTAYASTPDTTFNLFDPAIVPNYSTSCNSPSDPTCYGRIHLEIDHDWKAAGYCGTGTFCDPSTLSEESTARSTKIDVQGFVYWDGGNIGSQDHQYSGWELHPFTAWKRSDNSPPPPPPPPSSVSVNFTWTPVNPQLGQPVSFTANSTSFSTYNWDFGDGVTATSTSSTASHMYTTAHAYTVQVAATDSRGNTAVAQNIVRAGLWNPAVTCSPAYSTVEGVLGNIPVQRIPSNPDSTGADYSGGGFRLDGDLAYGSNPTTWPFYKRDLRPPCDVNGTPSLVELHNVTVTNVSKEQCNTSYFSDNGGGSYPNGWQSCDISMSLVTPGYGDDSTCPGCYMHRVYSVIDSDWNASGVAPIPQPVDGQRVDVEGFVYWNNVAVNMTWHSYTGWEIHPLTAWRPARPPITVTASSNPTNPTSGQPVSFSGNASGGIAPYTFTWDFGDGTNTRGNPVSHVYASGTYTVQVAATDSAGTVGITSQTVVVKPAPAQFSVSASPSSLKLQPGKTNSTKLTVTSQNGFSGNVTLSVSAVPGSPTGTLSTKTVTLLPNGSVTSTLTVSATTAILPGTYNMDVSGTSGNVQQMIRVPVTVVGFILTVNPGQLVIIAGSKGTGNITAFSIGGFTGSVSLSTSSAPSGLKYTINPKSVTLSSGGTSQSILTISTAANALPGNYTVTVKGSGGGTTRTVNLILTITSDFTISATLTSITSVVGSSKSSTINLKSLGFTGTLTISSPVSSAGLNATLNPTVLSFTPGQTRSSTLTVISNTVGNYTVTVIATTGSITHSVQVQVQVTDFSITSNPASLTTPRGSTSTSTIFLASMNGFAGNVNLADTVSPAGLKVTLSTTSVALKSGGTGTAVLTVSPTSTTPPGTYAIIVKATSGSLVHTFTILVTVT